jgi:glycosyltransferase involved in cell wall biosynthesis
MYIYHNDGHIQLFSYSRLEVAGLEEIVEEMNCWLVPNLLREYQVKRGKLVLKKRPRPEGPLKIAMVGVWDIPCGIATYAEQLVNTLRDQGHAVRVFAEHSPASVDTSEVIRCWRRGEHLTGLFNKLDSYNPDAIFIQHEYGIFPDARKWTKFISRLKDYNYHVVFHSVYEHKDKAVCEAICDNIIVHTEAAKEILIEKGVNSNINVIPHGCIELSETSRLWNIYRSPHTITQFGFGFEYKGWDVALEAVEILKEKYSDIFYLMLFSESPFVKDYHDAKHMRITNMIEEKGLEENVAVIRGFQSPASLNNFLRTTRVAIFPYTSSPGHAAYGSSGAVRLAMSNGTPVL